MMTRAAVQRARERALQYLERAGIVLTSGERAEIEIADFGGGDFDRIGLALLVYVNTDRCCAKELVLLPGQTCPEHWHPPVGEDPGKEETFRCRSGEVLLYVEGERTANPVAQPPADRRQHYTCRHEIRLTPGQQYTIRPGLKHWFQAGAEGAVVSEFSTRSRDEYDLFTDPAIVRETRIDG